MSVQRELHQLVDDMCSDDSKRALAAYRCMTNDHLPWLERRAVLLARRRGASWAAIARLLGRRRQSVRERFDRVFAASELTPVPSPRTDDRAADERAAAILAEIRGSGTGSGGHTGARVRRVDDTDPIAW